MVLSIIILNYKTKNLVKQCLKNIARFSLPFDYEVIVVDNNSNDGLAEMMHDYFPGHRLILNHDNRGMGAGNNLGLAQARGEYLLILNPDVVVLDQAIENLWRFIHPRTQIGLVAPRLLNPNRTEQQSRYRFPKIFLLPALIRTGLKKIWRQQIKEYFMEDVSSAEPHKIDWARGSALMLRRSVLERLTAGFDERFFMYMEDVDLCRRVWQSGYEVWYVPHSQMIHYYARESGANHWFLDLTRKMAWIHIISWIKYFWKWWRLDTK
ncbi:MAG TPA: glycosyltransferase family 2 protein [bacterium]|nr:glycosyltransferase family 2 protein [bacterium]HPL95495.1 glycosyltransferase family 2 protein [bacterium]